MSYLAMTQTIHELYVAVCKDCLKFKSMGASPATFGLVTTYSAQNAAREHTKETGHEVIGTFRREEKWVSISGEPPEG